MSSENDAPDKKRRGSKFKNGLKGLKRRMSKADKHADNSAAASGDADANLAGDSSKNGKRRMSLKKKKVERPRLPRLKMDEYEFPKQIATPCESWGELQYDQEDRILHEYLKNAYEKEIAKLQFFPSDIIIRFVVSQRGMRPFQLRKQETETHFQAYLKYHYSNHYDDILTSEKLNTNKSLSSLKEDVTALPLFIYGQDREGHPVFWDDGSAYAKDSDLEVFKKDMKRVELFRSRVMKRMHNIKLCASQKYGRMIYKHCLVMDLEGFNAKKFFKDRKFHEQNTKDISDLFPEVMHKLYIINAPWAFRSAWKVIQTFLHPITVEKTKILGKDYIDELTKDIDPAMIPYKFGGRGPWDVVYGEAPLGYPLSTSDIVFDYSQLPKNDQPVPPRPPVPDMNKHKAKQMKHMKESGMAGYEQQMFNLDDLDDEQKGDFYDGVDGDDQEKSAPDMEKAKSAPTNGATSTNGNANNDEVKQEE